MCSRCRLTRALLCIAIAALGVSGCKSGTHSIATPDQFVSLCARGNPSEVLDVVGRQPNLVSARSSSGDTGLHVAALCGNAGVLKILLKRGALVNATDSCRMTPLMNAVSGRHLDAARALLAAGADPNMAALSHTTALHLAIMKGNLAMVRLLIDGGADVNAPESSNGTMTPLWQANTARRKDIAAFLRAHGGVSR